MTTHEKILSLQEFQLDRYEGIDLDRLVAYAVMRLEENGEELSLENIIVASFKLFPKKFSMLGYPQFPDATRVEKCLWRCKGTRRGWVGGKTPHGYSTTEKGRLISEQVEKLLKSETVQNRKVTSQTRRKEAIISEVTSSRAFQKFSHNNGDTISEAEFCNVVQGTLDSLKETLKDNLYALRNVALELERTDVAEFLKYVDKKFSQFMNSK